MMTKKEWHKIKGKYMAFGPFLDPQVLTVFDALDEMDAALKAARDQLERERVRLAGVGAALLGATNECHVVRPGDYGWSPTYDDALKLRRKIDEMDAALADEVRHRVAAEEQTEQVRLEYNDALKVERELGDALAVRLEMYHNDLRFLPCSGDPGKCLTLKLLARHEEMRRGKA